MQRKVLYTFAAIYGLAAGLGYFLAGDRQGADAAVADEPASYILQGETTAIVADAVRSVSGEVTHEFRAINAVAATLDAEQREQLQLNPAILAINEDPESAVGNESLFDKRIM